jgi:hypothetical protein
MSLFDHCKWCDQLAHLRFIPGRALADQSRPTICDDCYWMAREQLQMQRRGAVPGDRHGEAR